MENLPTVVRKQEKGSFVAVHVDHMPYLEVDLKFIQQFHHELDKVWTLIDNKGCRYKVTYNRCKDMPVLIHGWQELRHGLRIKGDQNLYLRYMGNNLFHVVVLEETTGNSFSAFHSGCTPPLNDPVFFTIKLTKIKDAASHLDLPQDFASYVRETGYSSLLLRGAKGVEMSCKLLIRDGTKKTAKIGMGWKQFCRPNELKTGQLLKFEFENVSGNNIVNVEIVT